MSSYPPRLPSVCTKTEMMLASMATAGFTLGKAAAPASLRVAAPSLRVAAPPTLKAFSELRAFDRSLSSLESIGMQGLDGFWDADKCGFALTPSAPRFSVTTTIFALLAIDANPNAWTTISGQAALQQRVHGCLDALLDADWREDDVAQLVFVLTALRILDPQASLLQGGSAAARNTRISRAIQAMAAARPPP